MTPHSRQPASKAHLSKLSNAAFLKHKEEYIAWSKLLLLRRAKPSSGRRSKN